jgi:hypothetical protein
VPACRRPSPGSVPRGSPPATATTSPGSSRST